MVQINLGKIIGSNLISNKVKGLGFVVLAVFIGIVLFDANYLAGDLIAKGSVSIDNQHDFFMVKMDTPGEKYLIEVSTGALKTPLTYRLISPDGEVAFEDKEYGSHKGIRSFDFVPLEGGQYRLYVNPGPKFSARWGEARIQVWENNRRVISKLFGQFNI